MAYAEDAATELKQIQDELTKSQKAEKALIKQSSALEFEQKQLAEEMVRMAAKQQHNERTLTLMEDKLVILSQQLEEKNTQLKESRTQLDVLMRAAISLSQLPPEAAVMMPGDPSKIIDAARAVEHVSADIHTKSTAIAAELKELQALQMKVQESKEALKQAQAQLQENREQMHQKLKERAELYSKTQAQQEQQRIRSKELASKAENLQDLVAQLEKARKEKEEADAKKHAEEVAKLKKEEQEKIKETVVKRKSGLRSFESAKGRIRLPVVGSLLRQFGTTNGSGQARKGIVLKARENAQVTAPFDGEVVFTGPFLNYGNIVILRHTEEFHTLLAGFDTIQAKTGQVVMEGEPLGVMGEGKDDTQLYVELRKNNQPINPSAWMIGLAGK